MMPWQTAGWQQPGRPPAPYGSPHDQGRILTGGVASGWQPLTGSAYPAGDPGMYRQSSPWLSLAAALLGAGHARMGNTAGYGGYSAGAGLGRVRTVGTGIPSRRNIYGPGPKTF